MLFFQLPLYVPPRSAVSSFTDTAEGIGADAETLT